MDKLKNFLTINGMPENYGLVQNGISIRHLRNTNLNKIVFFDFVILSKKIIIEYDGVYWHSSEKQAMKDVYKTKLAEYNGFKLFRIRSDQPCGALFFRTCYL